MFSLRGWTDAKLDLSIHTSVEKAGVSRLQEQEAVSTKTGDFHRQNMSLCVVLKHVDFAGLKIYIYFFCIPHLVHHNLCVTLIWIDVVENLLGRF